MIRHVENEFWFLYTIGAAGEVVPYDVVRTERRTRTECLKRLQRKMRRERVDGDVAGLSFELELDHYAASAWCDAGETVSDAVGKAFFRTMMAKLLPSLAAVGV